MNTVALTSAYLAPVEYYMAIIQSDKILLENCDHYCKQTYRNRCRIVTANGTMDLSIPVEKISNEKQLTRDIKISYHTDWQTQHWRAIESAYNSTPFFEYYKDDLIPFYEKKWDFLWDFNYLIQEKILELIGDVQYRIELTTDYKADLGDEIIDWRENIHPKKNNHKIFTPYYQVFEQKFGFLQNVSIIDLLFNMGNESILILNERTN